MRCASNRRYPSILWSVAMPPLVSSPPIVLAAPWLLAQQFQGWDGFLGSRASFMLDLVFLAMFAIVPVMIWSIRLVQFGKRYELHKRLQLAIAAILLVAVVAFEVDMRFFSKWEERAEASPFYSDTGWSAVSIALVVHLAFAIPTTLLWIVVVARAWLAFPSPAKPAKHSIWHRRWGQFAAIGMFGTALTGWLFYGMAFVFS